LNHSERTTDFIFAVYSEESAWSAISFCWRCFCTVVRALSIARSRANIVRAMPGGVDRVEILLHLCICQHGHGERRVGRLGVPLPFISYGGTAP